MNCEAQTHGIPESKELEMYYQHICTLVKQIYNLQDLQRLKRIDVNIQRIILK